LLEHGAVGSALSPTFAQGIAGLLHRQLGSQ
jgi:hypothetical protein